jgi:transcriptional regulator with XRE-family HTH domain
MDAADKIREARERLRLSQKQVADRVGMTQQSYEAIEAGRTARSKFLPRIAQVLGLPLSELDPGLAVDTMRLPDFTPARQFVSAERDFPVYTAAEGGPGEIIRSADPVDWVPRPEPVARVKDAYGLNIVGESMVPEFEPGDVALVNPALPLIGNTTCIFYAELHGEARATIKRLRRASAENWLVRQWNPPDGQKQDFALSRREWGICHRVLGKYYRQ